MPSLIHFPTKKDERGTLTIIEKELPFKVERIFYIYDVKAARGGHGHLRNRMILVALKGTLRVCVSNKYKKEDYILNQPDIGLLLEPEDWHLMDTFSDDAVLLVLCSHSYDPNDYFYEEPQCQK